MEHLVLMGMVFVGGMVFEHFVFHKMVEPMVKKILDKFKKK